MEWSYNPPFLCRHLHLSSCDFDVALIHIKHLFLMAPRLPAGGGLSSGEHSRHHHGTSAAGKHAASFLVTAIVLLQRACEQVLLGPCPGLGILGLVQQACAQLDAFPRVCTRTSKLWHRRDPVCCQCWC